MRHDRAVHSFRFHRGPARRRGPVRQDKMQELRCDSCGNRVLVEKFSPTHTSVQWLEDAERCCPEFARRAASGEHSNWIPSCSALRDSIQRAVDTGVLPTDTTRCEPVPGRLGDRIAERR